GTLRNAIANASSGDHITFDFESTDPTILPYPVVIRLLAPIALNKDLIFDGPGAQNLTISGDAYGDGSKQVNLFTVNAKVTMNRLTFAGGYATVNGGAFEVLTNGNLTLSYCAVTNCHADLWGGGVDVNGGTLNVDHCLFKDNYTSQALGQGGGAISFYSRTASTIHDSTFTGNQQNGAAGYGGGAIYAETYNPGIEFDVNILNCTFRSNYDAGFQGSSLHPNVFNTFINVQNSIFADGYDNNFFLDNSGLVRSYGGNISDDDTYTVFSMGGGVAENFVFSPSLNDQTNIPAALLLGPLADYHGPTLTYAVLTNGLAFGASVSNFPGAAFYNLTGADQRGYFRTSAADIGAYQAAGTQRLLIEELGAGLNGGAASNQFVEIYVPRDSAPVDVAGYQLMVDGVVRHTFTSQWLQPGEALVVLPAGPTNGAIASYFQFAPTNLFLNPEGGLITLLNTNNQPVFSADYIGHFASSDTNVTPFIADGQSLVLSPQFQGNFLPYKRVANSVNGFVSYNSNPGSDVNNSPLSAKNAPPTAFADNASTDAHSALTSLPVLANDLDPDITDTLQIVGVGSGAPNTLTNKGYSLLGAYVTINYNDSNGVSVSYDPTVSPFLQSLPQGSNVVDSFAYLIQDFSNSVPHYRGADTNDFSSPTYYTNLYKATATVTINVSGVNTAPYPQPDFLAVSATNLLDFTTANTILTNDVDVNTDDNSGTLQIVAVCPTNGYVPNLTNITTTLGAKVYLDIRFNRDQAHIVYDPRGSAVFYHLNRNQTNVDTFYYTVLDRYGAPGTAAVNISVSGVDDGPIANPDQFATDENTVVTNPAAFFLGNDTDPDNGAVLNLVSVPALSALGAKVTLNGQNIVYDPTVSATLKALAQKETAVDTFTY
ncbi:MAG TPA: Ig-like domain-containing protein, partial [Verrucomicrobiae bacterium]